MKKYVLNIDRLYTGQTANALVLNQVDEDFPILVPLATSDIPDLHEWLETQKRIQPKLKGCSIPLTSLDELNEFIMNFNLKLQQDFKDSRHNELYMMDDTNSMKPTYSTQVVGKTYLHTLNGLSDIKEDGEYVHSSQMNVIFPFRKMSSKSLYATSLGISSSMDIDDTLEHLRAITLQGKISYEKCICGIGNVGSNLYVLSPNIDLPKSTIYGNGISIVNGYDKPFHFPHSMTLFQPSQELYSYSTIKEFKDWYDSHNHKFVVSRTEQYGTNVSLLKCLGASSYELELATYSPTNIVFSNDNWLTFESKRLDSNTLREIRSSNNGDDKYVDGKYIMDTNGHNSIGLMFNLYDTFISGNQRKLRIDVPINKDFNSLTLKFDWGVVVKNKLLSDMEVNIFVNETSVIGDEPIVTRTTQIGNEYTYDIVDTAVKSHTIDISVVILHDVDFTRRNSEQSYRDNLMESGVILGNIRLVTNSSHDDIDNLTFGSYVNEDGITQDEHDRRYDQFLEVSQYKTNIVYQTVLESSLKNKTSGGILYPNNYSSGDLYGDIFVTKSVLDSQYDMDLQMLTKDGQEWFRSIGRDYIGLGSCSDQLSLLFNPAYVYMPIDEKDDKIYIKRNLDSIDLPMEQMEDQLKFQRVEVVKNINRFESSIKHKSNVFSVVVENSNLVANPNVDENDESQMKLEEYKTQLRNSITQFVRNTCNGIVPVHTQLFDVQFT